MPRDRRLWRDVNKVIGPLASKALKLRQAVREAKFAGLRTRPVRAVLH
ncbi:MAG TPA: hypothetical protein VGD91_22525 [Trebonia sp.]